MFGLKLAITGLVLFFIASVFLIALPKYPGSLIGYPVLITWFTGVILIVSGIFISIWS